MTDTAKTNCHMTTNLWIFCAPGCVYTLYFREVFRGHGSENRATKTPFPLICLHEQHFLSMNWSSSSLEGEKFTFGGQRTPSWCLSSGSRLSEYLCSNSEGSAAGEHLCVCDSHAKVRQHVIKPQRVRWTVLHNFPAASFERRSEETLHSVAVLLQERLRWLARSASPFLRREHSCPVRKKRTCRRCISETCFTPKPCRWVPVPAAPLPPWQLPLCPPVAWGNSWASGNTQSSLLSEALQVSVPRVETSLF